MKRGELGLYYIKLDASKALTPTSVCKIYRGENLADSLIFLLPVMVCGVSVAATNVYVCYTRKESAVIEKLAFTGEMYKGLYYQYTLPITSELTRFPGELNVWLQLMAGGTDSPVILKSGQMKLTVNDSESVDKYFYSDVRVLQMYQNKETKASSAGTSGGTMDTEPDWEDMGGGSTGGGNTGGGSTGGTEPDWEDMGGGSSGSGGGSTEDDSPDWEDMGG